MGHAAERIDDASELGELAHLRARRGARKLASGVSPLPRALASSLDAMQVANDNGENTRIEGADAAGSCKWTSKDPIGFDGGWNLYAYCENDPINCIDPSGLDPVDEYTWWLEQDGNTPEEGMVWAGASAAAGVAAVVGVAAAEGAAVCAAAEAVSSSAGAASSSGAAAQSTALATRSLYIGRHTAQRMAERGINEKMVRLALEKGTAFVDPKNGTINYVLRGGFASGKDLLVGTNPLTGKITTVLRGMDLIAKRFLPYVGP